MIGYLFFGVLLAGLLLLLLNWWANAEVQSAKRSLTLAIIAVCALLALVLLATGKVVLAALPAGFALVRMFGPAVAARFLRGRFGGASARANSGQGEAQMSRNEALEVLGLDDGAEEPEINDAYRRLMAQVHPDKGGSDWMAAKLNMARRTLLDR